MTRRLADWLRKRLDERQIELCRLYICTLVVRLPWYITSGSARASVKRMAHRQADGQRIDLPIFMMFVIMYATQPSAATLNGRAQRLISAGEGQIRLPLQILPITPSKTLVTVVWPNAMQGVSNASGARVTLCSTVGLTSTIRVSV